MVSGIFFLGGLRVVCSWLVGAIDHGSNYIYPVPNRWFLVTRMKPPAFPQDYRHNGLSAADACCACGGG